MTFRVEGAAAAGSDKADALNAVSLPRTCAADPASDLDKAFQPIAEIRSYDDLCDALHSARELRGLSNCCTDELAGLTDGHTDKVLGPSRTKNLGIVSLTSLLGVLGVKLLLVPDPEQEVVMLRRWNDRQRAADHARDIPARISQKFLDKAKPHVLRRLGRSLHEALGDDWDLLLRGGETAGRHRKKLTVPDETTNPR